MIETGRKYHIINAGTGTALDLYNHPGSPVIGWDFHGGANQQWIFEYVGEGLRAIKSVDNGKYLGYRQPLQPDTDAVACGDTATMWALVQDPGEEDTYRIFIPNVWLQLSMKHPASVIPAQLAYPLPDRNQTWKIRPLIE